jgi:hypothetical protein
MRKEPYRTAQAQSGPKASRSQESFSSGFDRTAGTEEALQIRIVDIKEQRSIEAASELH